LFCSDDPPLVYAKLWAKDIRWGELRNDPEFHRILNGKQECIGPIHGLLWYFPHW
jgi:hypothetical protein